MKTNRWIPVIAGSLIFLFTGMVYAWGTFSLSISQEFPQWTQAQLSLTFSLVWTFFCLGGILSGMLAGKVKPTYTLLACGVLFLVSFLLTANTHSLVMLYLAFGVLGGLVTGVAYNTVLASVSKWFPSRPGLCSGILLTSFGFSAFLIGNTYQALTPADIGAWRTSFTVLGVIVAAVLCLCAPFIRLPGPDFQEKAKEKKQSVADQTPGQMLRAPQFWLFYIWATLLVACGSSLVSHANRFAMESSSLTAPAAIALASSLIAVCNGSSRPIFGWIFDRFGKRTAMLVANGGFALASLILIAALWLSSFPLVVVGFVVCGIAYGGMPPCVSAFIGATYGQKYYPINFSIYNTNLIIATLGSTLTGALYDATGSYRAFSLAFLLLIVVGFLLIFAITAFDRKKK